MRTADGYTLLFTRVFCILPIRNGRREIALIEKRLPDMNHHRKPEPIRTGLATDADVPASRGDRDRVHAAADRVAAGRRFTVPVGLEDLLPAARQMLGDENLPQDCLRYATVILSNALWRDTVAGIPFSRRLLLLPQCLRDSRSCPARVDEYGLVCARCGRCVIGDLVGDAADLGYVCLVTEGTAVVMSLIESGKVEAVIGVGCLDSLEEVFPYMQAGAVPGLALPLLRSGCRDTAVDVDRLLEALHRSADGGPVFVNTEFLQREVDGWFDAASLAALRGPHAGESAAIGLDWLQAGGKRWRPFLVACAHEALKPSPGGKLPGYLRSAAVAVECFHKASLVHDDIEDGDDRRYGRRTLHAEYGVPVALNVGDYLVGQGYRLLAGAALPPRQRAAMSAAAAEAHCRLCVGQGEELALRATDAVPAVEEVTRISRLKTAPAFEVALKIGCIAAGCGGQFDQILERFSEAVGIAYQVRDDILDAPSAEPGSVIASLAAAYPADDTAGLEGRARLLMRRYEDIAAAEIAPIRHPGLKILLHRIMAKICYSYRTMGCGDDADRRHDGDR